MLSVPGKRMQSSMSPTIILNDKNEAVFLTGASGGAKIISSSALVGYFSNSLHQGDNVLASVQLSVCMCVCQLSQG